jgi:hypothetical protein
MTLMPDFEKITSAKAVYHRRPGFRFLVFSFKAWRSLRRWGIGDLHPGSRYFYLMSESFSKISGFSGKSLPVNGRAPLKDLIWAWLSTTECVISPII